MKILRTLATLLALLTALSLFAACAEEDISHLWDNATYTADTTLGDGIKTIYLRVTTPDKSITLTIKTNADTLGTALSEHRLVSGERDQYGLYIKTVNGILADYDIDGSYWGFYSISELGIKSIVNSGVDAVAISGGETYELEYSK